MLYTDSRLDTKKNKMRSTDRILKLKLSDTKSTLTSKGLVDNRLFTGENNLHAVMDTQTCLWYLKYENGGLPQPLKQHFTGYGKLLAYVKEYFKRRNIEIVEEVDNGP